MDVARLSIAILQVYTWLIVARVVLSLVNPNPRNEILLLVFRLTEPLLALLRPLVPLRGLDLSPLLAWVLIQVLMRVIVQTGI